MNIEKFWAVVRTRHQYNHEGFVVKSTKYYFSVHGTNEGAVEAIKKARRNDREIEVELEEVVGVSWAEHNQLRVLILGKVESWLPLED